MRQLFELYAETDLPAKSRSMQENFHSCYRNHIGPVIGDHFLEEVTKTSIRDVLDRLKRQGKEGALRLTHSYLKVLFEFGLERDFILANPARVTYKLESTGIRERHLDEREIRAVLGLSNDDPATLLLRWLLLSGARLNEGREAVWDDIEEGVWTIPAMRTKNRKEHKLPITEAMQAILDAACRLSGGNAGSDFIFESLAKPNSPVSEPYVRKCLKAVASDAVPHDLRRTAATFMDAYGIPHESIKLILNHSQRGITASVYIRGSSMMKKRTALEKYHALLKEC